MRQPKCGMRAQGWRVFHNKESSASLLTENDRQTPREKGALSKM